MQGWTTQRVTQLAPDPASAKAGQALATVRKWVSSGFDEGAVWGECQGSGSKPYQVQVDLAEPAFKCSCPSRKFPCKHGLGLMLLLAADQLACSPRPAWVDEWFAGRAERTQKKLAKAEAPSKPVDEASQLQRREKRLQRIGQGLATLKLWIEDQTRTGVATTPGKGYAFFDEPARRMVDAQATGVARRLQSLATIASSGGGWQRSFVEELASLYLLIVAFEGLEQLPESTRDDVLATLGLSQSQEQVLALAAVTDRWQIVAQQTTPEDKLRVQRTWLFGQATRKPAMVLSFAHGSSALDTTLVPGFGFDGELCFFSGNTVRAAIKSQRDPAAFARLDGLESLDAFYAAAADVRSRQPWTQQIALPVRSITPVRAADRWLLVDRERRSVPCTVSDSAGWTLLAISGGRPVDVVLSSEGSHVRPLSAHLAGQYVSLVGTTEAEAAA